MPSLRPGPVIGLIVQFALLVVLASTTGLGSAGWLAGIGYAAGLCLLVNRAMDTARRGGFGPADRVTLTRALLIGCVTALVVDSFRHDVAVPVLVGVTVVALALDAVDGRVARRTGTDTAFGARFDMEADAFLILVLSVYAAPRFGLWVLAIGLMRYGYVAATWVLPWLQGRLFPRYWRKVVAAIQGIVLCAAAADLLPRPLILATLVGALALLTESFGRDVVFLWRNRATPAVPALVTAPAVDGRPVGGQNERVRA